MTIDKEIEKENCTMNLGNMRTIYFWKHFISFNNEFDLPPNRPSIESFRKWSMFILSIAEERERETENERETKKGDVMCSVLV